VAQYQPVGVAASAKPAEWALFFTRHFKRDASIEGSLAHHSIVCLSRKPRVYAAASTAIPGSDKGSLRRLEITK
jgi:hypothetical protein